MLLGQSEHEKSRGAHVRAPRRKNTWHGCLIRGTLDAKRWKWLILRVRSCYTVARRAERECAFFGTFTDVCHTYSIEMSSCHHTGLIAHSQEVLMILKLHIRFHADGLKCRTLAPFRRWYLCATCMCRFSALHSRHCSQQKVWPLVGLMNCGFGQASKVMDSPGTRRR